MGSEESKKENHNHNHSDETKKMAKDSSKENGINWEESFKNATQDIKKSLK